MAVLISLVVSLTTTPMMCAYILPREADAERTAGSIDVTEARLRGDARASIAARSASRCAIRCITVVRLLRDRSALNVYLFRQVSYSLFPVQDTGLMIGSIQGDQSISFQAMKQKLAQLQEIVQDDPGGRALSWAIPAGGRSIRASSTSR